MKKFALGLSLLVSVGLGMVGCGDSSDGGSACPDGQVPCDGVCIDAIEPTLTSIQPGVVDVDAEQVDGKRVTASDSANSYLMNKLLGQNIPPPYLQMPILGTLCAAKVDVVRQWIDDGAT